MVVPLPLWCSIDEPRIGTVTGLVEPTSAPLELVPPWLRLDHLLSGEPDVWRTISIPVVLRCWEGFLHIAMALHNAPHQFLLIDPHLDRWHIRVPSTPHPRSLDAPNAPPREGLRNQEISSIGVRFDARNDLHLPRIGEKLPPSFSRNVFSAPEVQGGAIPDVAADVFLTSHLALTLLTGGRVPVNVDEIPTVLAALRLWRPRLSPKVQILLDACLNAQPDRRPASPAAALTQLQKIFDEDRLAGEVGLRSHQRVWCYRERSVGPGKRRELAADFRDPSEVQDDDAIYAKLGDALLLAVVADGVSTTNLGCGRDASELAVQVIEATLRAHAAEEPQLRLEEPREATTARMRAWAEDAMAAAHGAIVRASLERFGERVTPGVTTPATTCVLALIFGDNALIAFVGDSSAFLVLPEGVARVTAPMNVGNAAVRRENTTAAAHRVDRPGALYAALGGIGYSDDGQAVSEEVPFNFVEFQLPSDALLVLCTDGVSEYLGEPGVSAFEVLVREGRRAAAIPNRSDAACRLFDALWSQAERQASPDNMTLMVLAFEFGPPPAVRSSVDSSQPSIAGASMMKEPDKPPSEIENALEDGDATSPAPQPNAEESVGKRS